MYYTKRNVCESLENYDQTKVKHKIIQKKNAIVNKISWIFG